MKKYFFVGISLVLIASITVLYATPFTWRYKVTTYIQTPEGVKSGSTVCEANRYYRDYYYPVEYSLLVYFIQSLELSFMALVQKPEYICEAAVIDLGDKGKLVVSSVYYQYVYSDFTSLPTFEQRENPNSWLPSYEEKHKPNIWFPYPDYYSHEKVGTKKVYTGRYPEMFTFADDNDPTTARMVYAPPYYVNDHKEENYFQEVYGSGYGIAEITVEITDEKTSRGIEKHFPWLIGMHSGHYLNIKRFYTENSVGLLLGERSSVSPSLGGLNKRALVMDD